jgi:hypothetical protein
VYVRPSLTAVCVFVSSSSLAADSSDTDCTAGI